MGNTYLEQLENDKFVGIRDGSCAIRVKKVSGNATGIPNQNSIVDREKAKFDVAADGRVMVKVVEVVE